MNKETFLNTLRERLSILDKKEIDDIIDEYSSHIDEKISHGDTEHEAVKGFGNVDDLAREILKGYKIASDYNPNDWFNNLSKFLNSLARNVVGFFENLTKDKNIDVTNALASILVAIILMFIVNVVVNIIAYAGNVVFSGGLSWYSSNPVSVIWLIMINLVRALLVVAIIYITYKNITTNKAPMFFKNIVKEEEINNKSRDAKNNNVKEKKTSTEVKKVKKSVNTESIADSAPINQKKDSALGIVIKVFAVLFSIPFIFAIIGFSLAIAVIIGLMIKGIFFFGILLILFGLILVFSAIVGFLMNIVGGNI